jgi:uncharacterized protein YkwD
VRVAGLVAASVAGLVALVGVSSAGAADASRGSLVATTGACPGADDPGAAQAVQRKAIVCLVNVARRKAHRRLLSTPPKLGRAAAIKGRGVASCGELSHTPCGSDATAAVRAAGYRYAWFGENLFLGTWGQFSPRQVVESWLGSPDHRANILRPSFRDFGVALVRARGVFGEASTAVWVATFASPR